MKRYDYLDISSVVEELMAKKESDEIEFKSAAGSFPKSFRETYSSFANTQGGTIVQVLQLGHDKVLTLAFALTESVVSNERLRFSLNKHKFDISKMLKELCKDGYLVPNEQDGERLIN